MALIVTVSASVLLAYHTRKVKHTHKSVKVTGKGKQVAKKKPALEEIIGSSSSSRGGYY